MNKEEEIKFKKKIKEETISREDELIDAAKRNAAIVSEFLIGAKWADQHPRKELVDKEKVEKLLGNLLFDKEKKIYRAYLDYDAFFDDFRKAMED